MTPEIPDAAFSQLKLPSYDFSETTPEVADEFRGFRIAAPKRLTAGGALRIPVSAVARFAGESAELPRPMWNAVAAVVVEIQTNRCWVGTLLQPGKVPLKPPADDEGPVPPPSGDDPEDDIHEISGGVASQTAHVDLRDILELPPTPATYEIHFTLGRWASNCVRVAVERPREEP